jgi:hypothetical protein
MPDTMNHSDEKRAAILEAEDDMQALRGLSAALNCIMFAEAELKSPLPAGSKHNALDWIAREIDRRTVALGKVLKV